MRHIKTPELLWPALRQYRHNTDNSPNINHPENGFVTGFDYDETVVVVKRLERQLADLLEAVLAYVGPVDDPHIGWRGSSPSHNDLFQCEACGAEDADTRAMQHTDNCTAAALLATIGQKP